ncbi:hypothetical protein QN277_000300 [Acacia crassicarpa]|uniref:Nucleotide-diphospho-sugar transferase domain-containing protein n=1 Tax=Acacia crassicarpa TaxID=499986 RepID=A0AAE1TH02_9FABA|nr:hypothetical protein QN277_000300 [Acacia crassicarpa]
MKDSAIAGSVDKTSSSSGVEPIKPPSLNSGGSGSHGLAKRVMKMGVLFVGFTVFWILLYNSASPFGFPVISHYLTAAMPAATKLGEKNDQKLDSVLRNASMANKTVIITTLNDAWAEPGSIFDLFLQSFQIGKKTKELLKHLVVVTWDQKAYDRCTTLHPHCYLLETNDNFTSEAFFMTPHYLKMMWKRIKFLGSVLEMGYSFVFTDTDIMWLRNPFGRFHKDADFQIACDNFRGNPKDMKNMPNGGFTYVKSNDRTIWFYQFWYNSRTLYPKLHDQDVLNKIKWNPFISNMKLQIRFLDTAYFGGFCQPSKNLDLVCTMHANCCVGLENKINDLKILLDDWKKYKALPNQHQNTTTTTTTNSPPHWTVPQRCSTSFERARIKE